MRTYKEFVSLLEQVTGATLGFRKTFGAPIGSSTAVTGSVQGGRPTGTQFSASGSLGRGTVSGQGDKINKGIDAAVKNYKTGSTDDTSTSTIRKGPIGSLSANVSGGGVRTASKPEPPKPKPEEKQPTERTSASQRTSRPTSAQVTSTSAQRTSTPTRSAPETAADREARWAAASRAKPELDSMAAIDRARIAKGEKPKSDVLSKYPGAGLR